MNVQDLCGYGVRDPDTGQFLEAQTRAIVEAIGADWVANPSLYPGMLRALPASCQGAPGVIRRALWDDVRQVLGKDFNWIPQAVGDCVGVSSGNAVEDCQIQAILAGLRATFEPIFPPFAWGMGRLAPDCGANQLGRQDGSMGAWQAKAVSEYGVLAADAKTANGDVVPTYSGEVARQWGNNPGPGAEWISLGKTHLVKSTALVQTWDDLCRAILAGNVVTVASNVGYTMLAQSDGFHHRQGQWGHQMKIRHVDLGDANIEAHAGIGNNWGDVHGQIVDFRTKDNWPIGHLRVRRADIESMLAAADSFAYAGVETWNSPSTNPIFTPF
jgi:hypothetical protein